MRRTILGLRLVGALLLFGMLVFGGARGLLAQDATPTAGGEAASRPAHVHTGTCDELGDVVQPLENLTAATGDAVGQGVAVIAETSASNIPMTLDDMLAEDHAVNVHRSMEEIQDYIACGEIGGVIDANGALTIGLKSQNASGFTGIAYLAPGADGASTDVSVFIAETQTGGETPSTEPATDSTPAASAAGAVEVTLSEFAIDMPTTLPAGETTFSISNTGEFPHNLEIEGEGIEAALEENLEGGQSGEYTVDLAPGTYEVYCPVGNHRDQGMELELTVE